MGSRNHPIVSYCREAKLVYQYQPPPPRKKMERKSLVQMILLIFPGKSYGPGGTGTKIGFPSVVSPVAFVESLATLICSFQSLLQKTLVLLCPIRWENAGRVRRRRIHGSLQAVPSSDPAPGENLGHTAVQQREIERSQWHLVSGNATTILAEICTK